MTLKCRYCDEILISSREVCMIFTILGRDEILMHFFFSAADSNLSHEERERRRRRAAVRSTFVQHLFVSILFDD
jgi:hypothetical protein